MIYTFRVGIHVLKAVSPIDGRYSGHCVQLSDYFSESALMKYRLQVQSQWMLHLLQQEIISSSSAATLHHQLQYIQNNFNLTDSQRVKEIEQTTNHDLKSIEYLIKQKLSIDRQWVHFCCTSQDINNLSYSLMLGNASTNIIMPLITQIRNVILNKAELWATHCMLGHTHGQPATPTTLGKQYANFAFRITKQIYYMRKVQIEGKFNGAVGNYNAHYFAYNHINWMQITRKFVKDKLKLNFNPYTTQIEPHDSMVRFFSEVGLLNTILIGLCKDTWQYISKGYIKQKSKQGEIGSSTMPHKINPIDFQNCQGNLGIANAMIDHFRQKLPISRQQRDLSDSTVLRNQGTALAYSVIGYKSLLKGLSKVQSNQKLMLNQLSNHYEVITEAIQTELRRVSYHEPYELLKRLSREQQFTKGTKQKLLDKLKLKLDEKSYRKIAKLKPEQYLGKASQLALNIKKQCSIIDNLQ